MAAHRSIYINADILDDYNIWHLSPTEWKKLILSWFDNPDPKWCRLTPLVSSERYEFILNRKKIRKVLFSNPDINCAHCGSDKGLTIDHIQPLSRGGTNDISNLQVLCKSCNSRKGNR